MFLFEEVDNLIPKLLDNEEYDKARQIINNALIEIDGVEISEKIPIQINLYGFLTDIGIEGHCEDDLMKSITFLKENENEILLHITPASFYYNLSNAFHGLAKIFYASNKGVHSLEVQKARFQDSINYMWLAFNKVTEIDKDLLPQIAINLSNSLITVGRMVEALQFLDIVLEQYPEFPQALVSRADHLYTFSIVSNALPTAALFAHIYYSYDRAIKTKTLPASILHGCKYGKQNALNKLVEYGFNDINIETELEETQKEFNQLSEYRQFCIKNFLTLNEHSIYCPCIAAEKDDLQLGVEFALFEGKIIAKLELLLNRLKSEYSYARWCYYQYSEKKGNFPFDAGFTELFDGEIISPESELLRVSYRICYGILDKIAHGICKLYDIRVKYIHFETFWDNKKVHSILNERGNLHLNALYSIACDLNTTTGELKQFKNWRNKMEHSLMILRDFSDPSHDTLKVLEDADYVAMVDINEFSNKAMHLLQITRAAIFSFAHCVRLETVRNKEYKNTDAFKLSFRQ